MAGFTWSEPGLETTPRVSHDREFVSSLATRIIELRPGASGGAATVADFRGSYEDYLAGAGAAQRAA
ncbi:MAG: hypothetical protein WBM28_07100 [Burkholderiales bacterium]